MSSVDWFEILMSLGSNRFEWGLGGLGCVEVFCDFREILMGFGGSFGNREGWLWERRVFGGFGWL